LTQSPKVLAVRKAGAGILLINHPVDCPICDQAGECWLQDYYMQPRSQASRFEVGKVHDRKRTIFGPNVVFDGERCINARVACVSARDHQDDELTVINRGDHSTIALFDNTVLDNPLSANVVDICPVGALTIGFRFNAILVICKKPVDLSGLQYGLQH